MPFNTTRTNVATGAWDDMIYRIDNIEDIIDYAPDYQDDIHSINVRLSMLENKIDKMERCDDAERKLIALIEYVDSLEQKIKKLEKIINWQTFMLDDEEDENWQ